MKRAAERAPHDTDESLMARYSRGDMRALDALFRRHGARIHAFFARSFRDTGTCEDLLQTTFLKLHATRASFDPAQSFRAWLYAIAARVRVDELRRRYRAPTREARSIEGLGGAEEPSVAASAEDSHVAMRVRAALDGLPEAQRLVVLLHRCEGLSFAEIAEVVGEVEGAKLTEGAMRVRAFRAYAALRRAAVDDEPVAEAR